MSLIGTMVDNVAAHVVAAVSGVTVTKEPIPMESNWKFPHCLLFHDGPVDALELDVRQIEYEVRIIGNVARQLTGAAGGLVATRELVELDLEAIRNRILADKFLGLAASGVTMAVCATESPLSSRDAQRVDGPFVVAVTFVGRVA